VEWCLQGKTEVPGENLSHYQFLYDKSQTEWPGIKTGPPRSVSSDLKERWRKKRKDDGQNLDTGKCLEEKIWNCDRRRDGRTHKVIPCSKVLPEKLIVPQTDKKLSQVIKPTGSSPCSQQPANCTYPEADQFSPRPPPHQPITRRSHLIASYHLLLGLPTKTVYHFSSACPAHPPIRFDRFNNIYISSSSSLTVHKQFQNLCLSTALMNLIKSSRTRYTRHAACIRCEMLTIFWMENVQREDRCEALGLHKRNILKVVNRNTACTKSPFCLTPPFFRHNSHY
jgi:hypothetical protein